MIDQYRFETHSIFEYSSKHNGYLFIGKVHQFTKEEFRKMKKAKCDEDHEIYREQTEDDFFN